MARRGRSQSDGKTAVIDERLPMPLYHQIYLVLRDKIIDGVFAANDIVPGEQEVVRQFGVSRITARRALDELAADGLVVRERGRGTRVAGRPQVEPVRAGVEGLLENLIEMGLKTEVSLLAFEYAPASPDVARALQLLPGAIVQHAIRSRSLEGKPFSYLNTYVPEKIGRTYSRRDLANRPLLTLLERSGVRISSAEQVISATLADPQMAAALQVEVAAPLLRITRIVLDQNSQPVEYIVGLYRPDRYQYRMKLDRIQERNRNSWSPAA
jgi:GntR family transcriptional regulator